MTANITDNRPAVRSTYLHRVVLKNITRNKTNNRNTHTQKVVFLNAKTELQMFVHFRCPTKKKKKNTCTMFGAKWPANTDGYPFCMVEWHRMQRRYKENKQKACKWMLSDVNTIKCAQSLWTRMAARPQTDHWRRRMQSSRLIQSAGTRVLRFWS